jgi:hypothetical protein
MEPKIIKKHTNITYYFPHGNNEPYCVTFVKSGWKGQYHVISEWGDSGDFTHRLMSPIQIIDLYRLDANDLPINDDVYCISKQEILEHPNDYDLGEFVRKKINNF